MQGLVLQSSISAIEPILQCESVAAMVASSRTFINSDAKEQKLKRKTITQAIFNTGGRSKMKCLLSKGPIWLVGLESQGLNLS